ncbi:MAG: nucleoside monophosphate kinase [Planctomycetota bacterium]
MSQTTAPKPNTLFIEVSGAGLPEVDGLFIPSTAPPAESESGTLSTLGYWNGKMAWDRADGKCERSPAISYSNSYKSWRICRLDGHLAYDFTCEDELPPMEGEWHVYKKGVAPAPNVVIHHCDPREPCPEPNVVFVLGGPGTGKGTMCELAESQLGWKHLSSGALLRDEIESGGPNAEMIESLLSAGNLAPDELTVGLLKTAMEKSTRSTGRKNFLLDGFPRCQGNLDAWHDAFGRDNELPQLVFFECPYEVLEKRILGRAKYTGRSDDNVESLKQRYETFQAETLPMVELFESHNRCVRIDSSQARQDVYAALKAALANFTDETFAAQPLTERAEMLLGLRPWPSKKV